MGDPAKELNSQIRAAIVDGLLGTGRQTWAESAKTGDLVELIGMLFAEISDGDGAKQWLVKVCSERDKLRSLLSDSEVIQLRRSLANANKRVGQLQSRLDAVELAAAELAAWKGIDPLGD